MIQSLSSAASALQVNSDRLDVHSNNIANLGSAGFKAKIPSQQTATGGGVATGSTGTSLQQGALQRTDQPLDAAIVGKGFFAVETNNGARAYTRAGAFQSDANGFLRTTAGAYVLSGNARTQIPANSSNVRIASDGKVIATDANGQSSTVATLQVDQFANESGLESLGEGLFKETSASGAATAQPLGSGGTSIASGFLETDNVDVVTEQVGSMLALRAFEVNAKTIQTADEMLKTLTKI